MNRGPWPEHPPLREIRRCPLPSRREFYRHHDKTSEPIVFLGGMERWPARTRWTFEWFKRTHGHVLLPVNTGRYDVSMTRTSMTLGEYIDTLQDPTRPRGYLSNIDIFRWLPELRKDVAFPRYRYPGLLTLTNFWMSAAGQTTQLHCDFQHNLVAQVAGKKRFLLYAPHAAERIFPTNRGWSAWFSQIDFEHPEPAHAAAARDLRPDVDVTLSPGEMLFLPFGWWHRVLTVEPAIGINHWWWTPRMALTQGPPLAHDVVFAYGPRYLKRTWKRWRDTLGG